MCMITHWKNPRIAKRNIICYKLLKPISDYEALSYVTNFKFIIGKTYRVSKAFRSITKSNNIISVWDHISRSAYNMRSYGDIYLNEVIEKNLTHISTGFHSFEKLSRVSGYETMMYRCIIPKGSLYYKSKDKLMVSNKIIIKEKIK